jgi:hypothetical protein
MIAATACDNARRDKARADSVAAALKVEQQAVVKRVADSLQAAESKRRADSIAAERAKPKTLEVFTTTGVSLSGGASQSYGFQLSGAGKCTVHGRVEAVAGGNKDVRVYIMTADEFTNWKNSPNGHARVLFEGDQQSVTTFDREVQSPGSYRLVISNRFSVLTGKTMRGDASVTCVGGPEPQAMTDAGTPER